MYMDNEAWPKTEEEVKEVVEKYYAPVIPLAGGIKSISDQLLAKPAGLLGNVYTSKYNYKGKVVLVGDSAHAIVPFFGQGMNCGFEDCLVLSQLIRNHRDSGKTMFTFDDFESIFEKFHEARKPSCDAIGKLALENFVEMRDLVADEDFLRLKKVEQFLEQKFPHKFRSRYSMVCYGSCTSPGNVSYHNALLLTEVIKEIAQKLADVVDDESLMAAKGEKLIDELLTPRVQELNMDLSTI